MAPQQIHARILDKGQRGVRPTLLILAGLLVPAVALARAGDLDPQFGTGGLVHTDFAGQEEGGFAVALDKDGRIYVGGNTAGLNQPTAFLVERYSPDGQLGTSWGSQGRTVTSFGGNDGIGALAVQKDGRVVVGGSSQDTEPPRHTAMALARYLRDGSPDPSFGSGGKRIAAFGTGTEEIEGLAIQKDGKIVAVGRTGLSVQNQIPVATVVRFLQDGTLDPTFGTNGETRSDFGAELGRFHGMALQDDGKILAAGVTLDTAGDHFIVARYLKTGQLDTHFGSGGFTEGNFPGDRRTARAVAVQGDGKIVAVGSTHISPRVQFALARFKKDGRPDSSFGTNGLVTTPFTTLDAAAVGVGVQDDKIVVAGDASTGHGPTRFAVARYTKKGQLDASFGTGGTVVTVLGPDDGGPRGLALQKNHRIVVAGFLFTNGSYDVELAGYKGK